MTISFDDIYDKLGQWGYQVTKEPMEQLPPGKIELRYDMALEPEDVAMTSYKVMHEVTLRWLEATPSTIATTITHLMGHFGKEYHICAHFEIGKPKIERTNGTMYNVSITVYWVQWLTVDI